MTAPRMKAVLVLFSLFILLPSGFASALPWYGLDTARGLPAARDAKRPLINGTFIQLVDEHNGWSRARWERLFDAFKAIGLNQIVVQWSQLDSTAFYTVGPPGAAPPPIETILQLAQQGGMEVHLGLVAESRYWEMIKQAPTGQEQYLERLRLKSEAVARHVSPIASRYTAFKGWYIPEEIDDFTWRPPASKRLLYRHLKQLSASLKKTIPGTAVTLSCFCNARMDPAGYEEFWRDLLRETSIDAILFQDAAGGGKLPPDLLPLYLKAARSAADANRKKLQVIVELFTMVSESPFKAIPAPFQRLRLQLQTAAEFASGGINSFSVPDYMSPEGSAAARELYDSYLKYRSDSAPLI
ncbi:MAG TPA: hypothetical protein DCZ75_13120 [Geobacter sp.]|nr:hypothetical protein [Geobacter sp.]